MLEVALPGGSISNRPQHLLRLMRQRNSCKVTHHLSGRQTLYGILHGAHHRFRNFRQGALRRHVQDAGKATSEQPLPILFTLGVALDPEFGCGLVEEAIEGSEYGFLTGNFEVLITWHANNVTTPARQSTGASPPKRGDRRAHQIVVDLPTIAS